MTRYLHEPVARKYPGSQGWRCECADVKPYKRHSEPYQCINQEDVDLWRAHYPDAVCSDRVVRTLIYLSKEFSLSV